SASRPHRVSRSGAPESSRRELLGAAPAGRPASGGPASRPGGGRAHHVHRFRGGRRVSRHLRRPAPRDMIVIAASAGGVQALKSLFRALPPALAATVAVVLHRSPYFESILAQVLGRDSALPVSEARHE